jgi:hypothetical protein
MIFVDAHNYIKRVYHGGGNPYTLFYSLLVNYQAETVQIVCDGPDSRVYRRGLHPGYKAGRDGGDDPVYWEVYNNCKELALLFDGVSIIDMTAGEADDFIALRAEKGDTVISNDRDLWPLVKKGVNVLINATTKVDIQAIDTKFDVEDPELIYLYKALVGDPSDKIPGKRGFGAAAWGKMAYEDKKLYLHHAKQGNFDYDPDLFTDQAIMSWKLAQPWDKFTYTCTAMDVDDDTETPMAFFERKGIVL